MIDILAGAFGLLGALLAHDLAAQALADRPIRPFAGTCPRCGAGRGWGRPRCPECGRRVGRELLLVPIGIALALGLANTVGAVWALLPYLGFLCLSLALALTDIDAFRIVDRLNLRGTPLLIGLLGLAALADGTEEALVRGLLGGAAYFLGTNLVFLVARGQGFGYGDVKLSAQLGVFTAYLSWGALGWSVFITALVGGLLSLVVLAAGLVGRSRA
ncbi:MAG TPA: prepilin peptidase, partial [Acidimicrobiia bacterium]|nr:prepilin peptidase [Acidimicrobiia bacterium]